jgi:hypothetical protein
MKKQIQHVNIENMVQDKREKVDQTNKGTFLN